MILLTKLLPIFFLLHIGKAEDFLETQFKPTSRIVEVNFFELDEAIKQNLTIPHQHFEPYWNIIVVSRTRPTTVELSPARTATYRANVEITRLSNNGTERKRCSLMLIRDSYVKVSMMVYSLEDDFEVFSITKNIKGQEPTTDLFVVDMKTCKFTEAVLPISVHDVPLPGKGFIAYRPKDFKFEIFSLGGRRDCGTHICKRVYDINKKMLMRPVRFNWLDNEPDRRDRDEIFDIIPFEGGKYIGIQILNSNLAKVTYLTNRGNVMHSGEFFTDSIRFMEISSTSRNIGICYSTMRKQTEVHCQVKDENGTTKSTISKDVGYNIESMTALHLKDRNKMILLMLGCELMKDCKKYRLQMLDWSGDSIKVFQHFGMDKQCLPKTELYLTLYQENENICVFYRCEVEKKQMAYMIMNKCFKLSE